MKVTDKKAADLFLARKPGKVSSNTEVIDRGDGVIALELFGNEIAWHYPDGRITVRTTVASYTTHMRLNALARMLKVSWCAFKNKKRAYVQHNGVEYSECEHKEFVLRREG